MSELAGGRQEPAGGMGESAGGMRPLFQRPESLTDALTHYCPGCAHGVVQRLVAEVIDELGVRRQTIGVASVGCSVLAPKYFNLDMVGAPHGRAPAVATGIKRARPDLTVFTYQGDGDLASIGIAEALHAGNRGEKITLIMYNNANYGMTGGQMSPTTLLGQRTDTSPFGREAAGTGYPLPMTELLAQLPGCAYVARVTVHNVAGIAQAKKAVRRAFAAQHQGLGLGYVEVLGNCPTNWGMTPEASLRFVAEQMVPVYPTREFRVHPALGGRR